MLKDDVNVHNALQVKRILDGEIECSTNNLRICYLNASKKEYDSVKACLREMEEKLSPEVRADPFMQKCMESFKEKIDIYDRFFQELSRREKEGIE